MPRSKYQTITSKEVVGKIYQELEAGAEMGWLQPLLFSTTSNSASEKYSWLGHVPKLREWKGPRLSKQLLEHDYTITNKKYEVTMDVSLDDLDRDKTGHLDKRIGEFSGGSADHWAELVSTLIDSYSSYTCYDGSAFFAAHSAEGDSGTTTNLLTSTEVSALNVSTATAPTAAECTKAILGIIGYMMTFKDDQGRPINRGAKSWTIMCGNVNIWSPMIQAAVKDIINDGGAATDNILKGAGYNVNVVFNPWLTASSWTTTFTVYRADAPIPPFIAQQEGSLVVQSLAEGSDYEFDNDAWKFGLKTKRAAGYGFYHYASHATLS